MKRSENINLLSTVNNAKQKILTCAFALCFAPAFSQNQKIQKMTTTDFTTDIVVDQTPEEVFNAVTNPRGWWSEEIEGGTAKLNDEFTYHYKDVHECKIKLTEVIPNKKVVWHVLDNYFNFTKDKSEWVDTKIIFEISEKGNKTQLHFTHLGLVPEYECYSICNDSWDNYIKLSLRNLIVTGKGQPNPKDKEREFNEQLLKQHNIPSAEVKEQPYQTSITVDMPAHEAFENINQVTKWWTENLEGSSQNLNDEFSVRFGDVHYSSQKLVEVVPDKKVVWLVTDSKLNFITNQQEWTNTKISFEIFTQNNKTEVRFTHHGLVPAIECFNACSNAWSQYIQGSLWKLLTTGKGQPEKKEG
jgi:uncharacterized protein YndB with AHSA1/START domain